ncbi:MAG: hypothetical protein ACKPI8_01695 [Microcystis panniformis]
MAVSYQLSVISYQLSVISYQLSVISYQLSVISYQLSVHCLLFTEKLPTSPHPTPHTHLLGNLNSLPAPLGYLKLKFSPQS